MRDLREFIKKLEEWGELKTIHKEVHWNLQAPALCAKSNEEGGPAFHFTKIKDYPEGYSLAGSLFTGPGASKLMKTFPWSRQAVALGLSPFIHYEEFIDLVLERTTELIKPIEMTEGPCKEVIKTGEKVDIFEFPIPFLHEGDGGRYGTGSIVIVKDPETGWENWGVYRWMVLGKDRLVGLFQPETHLSMIYRKYQARKEKMPFCIVMGGEPVNFLASAMSALLGLSEAEVAGGLQRDPILLIKAEANDLLIPARAEIVLEGEVDPFERAEEGPFPEYIRHAPKSLQPVYQIKVITHRKNPILPFSVESNKVSDSLAIASTNISLELLRECRMRKFPVRWVNCPVETMLAFCIVSTKVPYNGYVFNLARFLYCHPLAKWFDKMLVLDDDVAPIDFEGVITDMIQKVHPGKGYHLIRASKSMLVDYSNSDKKNEPDALKLYIDATIPVTWEKSEIPMKINFENCYPANIRERVLKRWKEDLGFE